MFEPKLFANLNILFKVSSRQNGIELNLAFIKMN